MSQKNKEFSKIMRKVYTKTGAEIEKEEKEKEFIRENHRQFYEEVKRKQKENALTDDEIREKFLGKKVRIIERNIFRVLREDEKGFYVKWGNKTYVQWDGFFKTFTMRGL